MTNIEIKTSMVCNLVFVNNTTLLCFFFFFLVIDLYFLIPAVIAQIFNPTAELVIQSRFKSRWFPLRYSGSRFFEATCHSLPRTSYHEDEV